MRSPLLTPTDTFDLAAIMSRAWGLARHDVKVAARWSAPITLQAAFRAALRRVWDDAKSARSLALWAAEQAAAREARKALDDRSREIEELRIARAAADGIDSTARYISTIRALDARLAEVWAS